MYNKTGARFQSRYFTELTVSKGILYLVAGLYVAYCSIACFLLEPFMTFCDESNTANDGIEFGNPAYKGDSCRHQRFPVLLWLSLEECSFGRRIGIAALLGGLIGWERRAEDRPAGIRTMALVSLGACLFSICSTSAFLSGPMTWDASRVSAAIPSGVGFIGAGLIFKNAEKDENGDMTHSVHGITTAASLWISAAVGIACGGELYFAATHCVAVMLILLRFGPRAQPNELTEEQAEVMRPESPPPYIIPSLVDIETQGLTSSAQAKYGSPGVEKDQTYSIRRKHSIMSSTTHRSNRPTLME